MHFSSLFTLYLRNTEYNIKQATCKRCSYFVVDRTHTHALARTRTHLHRIEYSVESSSESYFNFV